MKDRQRVVWFEGMTLDPHHFQQWDRYQQGVLSARVRAVVRNDWGLLQVEIDRDRLANGEVVLVRARGVLPDGLPFDIPESDASPGPRNLQEHFPAAEERLGVFLVLPAERPDGSNVALQGGRHRRETRFVAASVPVVDDNTGVDERHIEVARANFQLRFSTEPLVEHTALQVAEVVRKPGGAFALDEHFIPPCLSLRASDRLMALARRALELLVARSSALWERRRGAASQRELSPGDVTALQLLATVNTYIPLVNHYLSGGGDDPEAFYLTLAGLAGQLSASVPGASVHPKDLPRYDYTDLSGCFNALDEILGRMLGGAAPPSNYVQVPLQQQRENLYVARLEERLLERAQLFLVTRSTDLPESRLAAELPQMLRVASPATIDAVLRSYTRALTIEHTHRLPVGMPVDQQASYFQLQKRGPFWESILENGALALFIPREYGTVNFRLIAVEEPS